MSLLLSHATNSSLNQLISFVESALEIRSERNEARKNRAIAWLKVWRESLGRSADNLSSETTRWSDRRRRRSRQENTRKLFESGDDIKSLVEVAPGNDEAARRPQQIFSWDTVEEVADNTHIVGHIKGGIHYALGDLEHGDKSMKRASVASATAIGGFSGGPAGAVAAYAAANGAITGIDSAVSGQYKPHGVIDYFSHIRKADAGKHLDNWSSLAQGAIGGGKNREK